MSRVGRGVAAVAALLALTSASACSPETLPPPPPAPVHDRWPGCVGVGAFQTRDDLEGVAVAPSEGGVPDGFAATSVVLCDDRSTDSARTGLERTSAESAPLLTYLARPSEAPSDGPCTADAWIRPWLFLLDRDGRYVAPEIPVDGCGKPFGWYDDREALAWLSLPYVDRVVPTR